MILQSVSSIVNSWSMGVVVMITSMSAFGGSGDGGGRKVFGSKDRSTCDANGK